MLKLYEYDDLLAGYAELSMGTMLRPLAVEADSLRRQDSRITTQIFVRNDTTGEEYESVTLQFINIPSSWTAKMVAQDTEPTEAVFDVLPNGNIVSHANVTDLVYHSVWVEITIPQGTPPAVFGLMKMTVHGTRKVT